MEYFLSDYYKESFYENKVISEKFLIKVLETMNISINKELIDKLMKYLIPAIYRIKNNFIIYDSLDYNAINLDVFCRTKYAIEENSSYLNEPLREEEIYHISKIIENHITKKISLKELLLIIDKHKNKNQLIQILKNRFDKFIIDDIFDSDNYNILKLLKKNNIFIFNKPITLEKILNRFLYNGLDNKSIIEFNNIVANFGKYFFIYKKIFLLSTGYINNNKDKSNLYLVISKSPIIIDDEEANILFFMHVNNRTEHLEYISEIMKLADIKDFVENIKVKNTSKDIISYIKNAINKIGEQREQLTFGIDGAVIKVDNLKFREILGSTAKTPRWAIAYKYPPEKKQTILKDIVCQVRKNRSYNSYGYIRTS